MDKATQETAMTWAAWKFSYVEKIVELLALTQKQAEQLADSCRELYDAGEDPVFSAEDEASAWSEDGT